MCLACWFCLCQPSTVALHELIARTAEWCVQHGVQAEVMLKATQANRAAFAFLHPTHPLHHYFTYLKQARYQDQARDLLHNTAKPRSEHSDSAGEATRGTASTTISVQPSPDLSDVVAALMSGPPPGIRRQPMPDTKAEALTASVSNTVSEVSQSPPNTAQHTEAADGNEAMQERKEKQTDPGVAHQLLAAKQRLLARIAQRASI